MLLLIFPADLRPDRHYMGPRVRVLVELPLACLASSHVLMVALVIGAGVVLVDADGKVTTVAEDDRNPPQVKKTGKARFLQFSLLFFSLFDGFVDSLEDLLLPIFDDLHVVVVVHLELLRVG